jgi:hypothetical protein
LYYLSNINDTIKEPIKAPKAEFIKDVPTKFPATPRIPDTKATHNYN